MVGTDIVVGSVSWITLHDFICIEKGIIEFHHSKCTNEAPYAGFRIVSQTPSRNVKVQIFA